MKNQYILIIAVISCIFVNAQIFTVDITASEAFNGINGSAILQIDDAGNDRLITRPLIVAEGYDSGLLGVENPLGENDISSFMRSSIDSDSDNLNDFLTGDTRFIFGDQDYDIIYINWTNGRDDLRRNALVLQEVIAWVNAQKILSGSTTPNVVLGQSMGGVIARYTLASMEQDNDPDTDHDTSLYISHDAPQQGANIPLGIQYFARHLADEFVSTPLGDIDLPAAGGGAVSLKDIEKVFNSMGTCQLISNNINGNFNLDNSDFDTFQTDLRSKGYPQLTRNISISNGSHCANDQEVGPQEELLYIAGEFEPSLLTDFLIQIIPFAGALEGFAYAVLADLLNNPAYLAGLLPGRTNFNVRFESNSLPVVNQIGNIYKGRIRLTKKIDFVLFSLNYNINITDKEYNNPSVVTVPLDSYPGGSYPVTFDLSDLDVEETNNWLFNLEITGRNANNFNFIPTVSSLDVGGGNIPLDDMDYKTLYNAENRPAGSLNIPFDNYTTSFDPSGLNETHISFNRRNGDWLALELDNIAANEQLFNCTFACEIDSSEITGPDLVCDTATYSLPAGADNYNWNVDSSKLNILGITSNSITVEPVMGFKGPTVITATVNSPNCNIVNEVKILDIWVGTPLAGGTLTAIDSSNIPVAGIYPASGTYCDEVAFRIDNIPHFNQVDELEWEMVSGQAQWDGMARNGSRLTEVVFFPECDETVEFRVRYKNSCGFSDWTNFTAVLDVCGTICTTNPNSGSANSINFTIFPNPADDLMFIDKKDGSLWTFNGRCNEQILDSNGDPYCTYTVHVEIFDGNSTSVLNTFHQLGNELDVSSLSAGNYVMHISHWGQTEVIQIIIQ